MFNNHIEVCHLQIVFTSYKCPVLHWFDCRFLGNVLKKSYKKAFNFSCASFSGAAHVIRLLEETKTLQCSVSILDYKCVPTKQLRSLTAGM